MGGGPVFRCGPCRRSHRPSCCCTRRTSLSRNGSAAVSAPPSRCRSVAMMVALCCQTHTCIEWSLGGGGVGWLDGGSGASGDHHEEDSGAVPVVFGKARCCGCGRAVCISKQGEVSLMMGDSRTMAPPGKHVGEAHGVCRACDTAGLPMPRFAAGGAPTADGNGANGGDIVDGGME